MVNRFLVMAAMAAVAGCVPTSGENGVPIQMPPGKYTSYHDLNRSLGYQMTANQSAPQEVKDRFAECFADYAGSAYTPNELAELDSYASGYLPLTREELARLDAIGKQHVDGSPITTETLSRFDSTCPNDVPTFRKYLHF